MTKIPEYKNIFHGILNILDNGETARGQLIDGVLSELGVDTREGAGGARALNSRAEVLRSQIGTIISEMEKKELIRRGDDGKYARVEARTVIIRLEECEEEILKLVTAAPMTKAEIRDALVAFFGTDKTATVKDDNRLFTYIGQILKRLTLDGVFSFDGALYSAMPQKSAYIKNLTEMLDLKASFLSRIHSHGGEFFEHYFLNLLSKYLTRMGKRVTEGYVTGGSDDGGIDAVVSTVDSLGFRETVMVQTKNRVETVAETAVRGFYGAVCAKQGSRGIFATISDFHPSATRFLNSIDNCVGVNGDKIFAMACDTSYGIIRDGGKLKIDNEII